MCCSITEFIMTFSDNSGQPSPAPSSPLSSGHKDFQGGRQSSPWALVQRMQNDGNMCRCPGAGEVPGPGAVSWGRPPPSLQGLHSSMGSQESRAWKCRLYTEDGTAWPRAWFGWKKMGHSACKKKVCALLRCNCNPRSFWLNILPTIIIWNNDILKNNDT